MKKSKLFNLFLLIAFGLSACEAFEIFPPNLLSDNQSPEVITTQVSTNATAATTVTAKNPCIGASAPKQWQHVVVVIFENKTYDDVIGTASYITKLAEQCSTVTNWKDADTRVDGSEDGDYKSKPSYATLTSGVSPSEHGLTDDTYETTTNVDNIYHQLQLAGKTFKNYYDGEPGGCNVRFEGDYHDALRYYTNVANICNEHDAPLSTLLTDLYTGNLPAFSLILPSNKLNMHDNSVASGDAVAQSLVGELLSSEAYAKGDMAVFFIWDEAASADEDTGSIPNILIAPSVQPGVTITSQSGNPISHFSALRTWSEMLGLPLIGDTAQAPSLMPFFGQP